MSGGLAQKREMAEGLLQSLYNMDIGVEKGSGFSIEEAVARVGVDSIHFIWAENILFEQLPELRDHLGEFPDGLLVRTLRYVVHLQVVAGVNEEAILLNEYGLLG